MTNHTTLTGNLTAEPELRFTPSGAPVANFTVAYTPRRKTDNGWEDAGDTLFLPCSLWRDDAEALAEQNLEKGRRVTVTGRLKSRSWEKDGQRRTVVELDADSVAAHPRRADRSGPSPRTAANPGGGDPWHTQEPPF